MIGIEHYLTIAVGLLASTMLAQAAMACSGPGPFFNVPTLAEADCSFRYAGENNGISGRPVQDLGSGLIVQRISESASCISTEDLLVVQCDLPDATMLYGQSDLQAADGVVVAIGGYSGRSLETVLAPNGPMQFIEGDSLQSVRQRAESVGVRMEPFRDRSDVAWDSFSPFCGCQLFYPDSPGATQ